LNEEIAEAITCEENDWEKWGQLYEKFKTVLDEFLRISRIELDRQTGETVLDVFSKTFGNPLPPIYVEISKYDCRHLYATVNGSKFRWDYHHDKLRGLDEEIPPMDDDLPF